MTRRRATDPQTSDFASERIGFGPLNGHTKWVVGVVSAFIVAALGAGLWADWVDMKATSRRNETAIAVINTNLHAIQLSLEEIKLAIRENKAHDSR